MTTSRNGFYLTQEEMFDLFRPKGLCGQLLNDGERVCILAVGHEGHELDHSIAVKTEDMLGIIGPEIPPPSVNEADVIQGDFYWVWVDPSHRHTPNLPPILVVATAWWHEPNHLPPYPNETRRLMWEGCGTDEGVRVLSIVARIEPPAGATPP